LAGRSRLPSSAAGEARAPGRFEDGDVTEHYDVIIVGTSIFPSIGAVNPALTAMANAIRVGEHLLSRMS
jgi:choline dehydrogenase-like flavoprotein